MSYNQYSGYGGNPYGGDGQQQPGYGSSNPYGNDGGNPYGGGNYGQQQPPLAVAPQTSSSAPTALQYNTGPPHNHNQTLSTPPMPEPGQGGVQYVSPGPSVMSNSDFLSRVEAIKADIRTLTTYVGQIASVHQRSLSSTDSSSSSQLESIVTNTQVLNTNIKDQIKLLETDAVRSKDNNVKSTQISSLKSSFQKQLVQYRQEEADYRKGYREQIVRQYRIVNPEASDAEVQEAADADWGNEGVFQTALKSNRSATAASTLGAVRARHNDIQKIERTMLELNALMEELASTIILQEDAVQATEQHTDNVKKDTEAGNVALDKGIDSARRARKLKWWCFFIVLAIVIILGLVLGLYFGLNKAATN